MPTITADDIRVLAQSTDSDPALAVVDGDVRVVPDAQAADGHLIYTKADLVETYGEEITDVQAAVLAAGLTAQLGEPGEADGAGPAVPGGPAAAGGPVAADGSPGVS